MSYTAPTEDMGFVLRRIADLDALGRLPDFAEVGVESTDDLLAEAARFMENVVAPTNRTGDMVGSVLGDDGNVTTPEGFRRVYEQFVSGGWPVLAADPTYGGGGFPQLVGIAVAEMLASANMAFSLCPMLTQGVIDVLSTHGSAAQRACWLSKLVEGTWTGTMLLTEPQAGSDVGALTTRAERQDDGSYRLFGQKIFITWGEHDMAENIVHCVLARTADAPVGTRGISLFLVPKFLLDADGRPAERNAITCLSLEHKMGIHASPTCVMEMDGAVAELVGEEQQGMAQMFTMMNNARLMVGVEGLAIAERAEQQARRFATERLQGRRPDQRDAGQVPIISHPDVQRMLLEMRSRVEAMRGLLYLNAEAADLAEHHPDPQARERAAERVAVLTPISKAWCSDVGVQVASLGIQVHGGMGFIEETGAAQHYRDSRIAPIYEGTNGIQAIDLVGRKLPLRDGRAVAELLAEMAGLDARLDEAVAACEKAAGWLGEHPGDDALAGATPFLEMLGLTVGGWVMARAAAAVTQKPDEFSEGFEVAKQRSTEFYLQQVLPKVSALLPAVTAGAAALVPPDGC